MTHVSKVICHNILGNTPTFTTPNSNCSQKYAPFLHVLGVCVCVGCRRTKCTFAWRLEHLKLVQEWGVLLCVFQRLHRSQKSILQSHFKNEGLMRPGATSIRLQRPINRKRRASEHKQCGNISRVWQILDPQDSLFEWQQ